MSLFDGVARLRASLDYHLARHNLLTANLAHVDTPGYRPVDLERTPFRTSLDAELQTAQTAEASAAHQSRQYRVIDDPTASPGLDGNGVSLDRAAVKIAANQLRYDTVAALTTSELSDLVWAASDGGRVTG